MLLRASRLHPASAETFPLNLAGAEGSKAHLDKAEGAKVTWLVLEDAVMGFKPESYYL